MGANDFEAHNLTQRRIFEKPFEIFSYQYEYTVISINILEPILIEIPDMATATFRYGLTDNDS